MKNIFDWLKAINTTKPPVELFTDKDWEVWNSYMIHRFLSMNKDFIEIVNYVQNYPPQEKKAIYSISSKEAKEYIYLLEKQTISSILSTMGIEKKEITKLTKL